LAHFKSNVAAADYCQLLWEISFFKPVFRMNEVNVCQTLNRRNETARASIEHQLRSRYHFTIDANAKPVSLPFFDLCMTA